MQRAPSFVSSTPSAPCDRRHASTASRKPAPGGPLKIKALRIVAPPPDHAPWPAATLRRSQFHPESPNTDTPGGPGANPGTRNMHGSADVDGSASFNLIPLNSGRTIRHARSRLLPGKLPGYSCRRRKQKRHQELGRSALSAGPAMTMANHADVGIFQVLLKWICIQARGEEIERWRPIYSARRLPNPEHRGIIEPAYPKGKGVKRFAQKWIC